MTAHPHVVEGNSWTRNTFTTNSGLIQHPRTVVMAMTLYLHEGVIAQPSQFVTLATYVHLVRYL